MKASFLGLLFLATNIQVHATPVYYSFGGTVNRIADTRGDAFVGGQIALGDAVSYVFAIDRDLQGVDIHHQIAYVQGDGANSDSYFVEYIGGTTQQGISNSGSDIFFWGMETKNSDGTYRVSFNGSEDGFDGYHFGFTSTNRVQILGLAVPAIDDWQVGLIFRGSNDVQIQLTPTTPKSITIYSDLSLLSISDSNPLLAIPEPSTIALFGLGTIGLGIVARRRKTRTKA